MDTEDVSLESKCENLMNIVVESRKRFGKTCVDYDQKILLMEKKLLNLQVDTISNYRFKPKNPVAGLDTGSCKDSENFLVEILEKQQRIDDLRRKLKNTNQVVSQLKSDVMAKKLCVPLTAEAILARVKPKEM